MSDSDLEEVTLTNWFDSESNLPEISSVNYTPELGVNVSSPSAKPIQDQALGTEDSSAMSSAPNKGNPIGHAPLEETDSYKGVNMLDTPNHTPPRSKSPSPFSCTGWPVYRSSGQGGHACARPKNNLMGIAHFGFLFLVNILGEDCPPLILCQTVPYYDNYSIVSKTICLEIFYWD